MAKGTGTPSPAPSPAPEPTAYCPSFFMGDACLFVVPGGGQAYWGWYCPWCTSTWTTSVKQLLNPQEFGLEAAPAGFTLLGSVSDSPNNVVDCTQGCSLGPTCSTCTVNFAYSATTATLPANFHYGLEETGQGGAGAAGFVFTTTFAVNDLDITGTNQSVGRYSGSPNTPSPEPTIMVGQQVKLQAALSSQTTLQWYFDTTNDMVSDYALKDNVSGAIASVALPQPVQPAANPNTFYWITSGSKHGYVTGTYSGVSGPLVTDFYYSVATPVPSVAASPLAPVALPSNYPVVGPGGAANCTQQINTAIAVGDPCITSGIAWKFQTTSVPSYGAGKIAMLQIVNNISASGVGVPSPGPASYSTSGLDVDFPYANVPAVSTSATWASDDSPAYVLNLPPICSSVTYTGSFTDYFMYQPAATSSRSGSLLWVTLETMTWGFSGTASNSRGVYKLSSPQNPSPVSAASSALPSWSQLVGQGQIGC